MEDTPSLVDRLRPLLIERPLGEQLFVIALLESRSADRYREWAGQIGDPEVARGLAQCAEREDAIATRIHRQFADVLVSPTDLDALASAIQAEVVAIYGGRTRDEQFVIQAQAERAGQGLWTELAEGSSDAPAKRVLLECAALEAGSAEFLEQLTR